MLQDDVSDIKVNCLQTEQQAILDIDDLVVDVCDDKETVYLLYILLVFIFAMPIWKIQITHN